MEYAGKLERLNEELRDFAFVAAHDLQEPLRKIQTFCDMAIKRCGPGLDSTGREYLGKVVGSASRMRELLHALLQFSRVAENPGPFKEVDLGRIVGETVELFEADLSRSGGLVEVGEIPAIEADEAQMLRLFQNLLGNALKYRGEEAPRIRIHATRNGEWYELTVEDNGIGFDQQYAERIFKPFQRLHHRDEYEGAGMGLAICRKIAQWHGGSIRAESESGKGSRFVVVLPVRHGRRES
jgi:light-regulated signal transduction histidine kinase (bacteriophytochrome)